ncbi:cobyrinate a,c-diamide synthase [Nocardioides jiangxiensis]|uniref:Hydrogenobyrinate a,c-diamide synthase n=1 Tax=Nocardioides jiangxiensis TaxID=3064524 RepID=A0ABT9B0Z7_9ACTN|nr:cobyrinate a,c-diamide synthase [Nocardioides sp. WY-20]MDO7867989.1 cobyrinate a,c-diamide synthase [Nocardioides sp. WY-20]
MTTTLPRFVVAAPGSGHGKTMIATGLMAALRARGLEVSPHKVGPDYIDPSYHGLAAGRVGRNLDPMLQGEERIVPLLLHGALTPTPADVAVIEGVMGLFDGQLGGAGFSSTAHVARLVQAPVVLVVDCAAASRSVGAVVHGFTTYDPEVRVAGVILNNVASPRHEAEVRASIVGIPVLGVVPRLPEIVVPSRHLGLIPVAERAPEALAAVDALADLISTHVDLDALLELAGSAPALDVEPWSPSGRAVRAEAWDDSDELRTPGPTVAVFGGPAFSFTYAENVEQLTAAGAHVVTVDPLAGDRLPVGTAAVVIGGGFPEMHLDALAANAQLLEEVRAFAAAGGPTVAECAGLLYLGQVLDGVEMAGVVPMTAAMTKRLTLGYRRATALADGPLVRAGEQVTGHEFHKTAVTYAAPGQESWRWELHDGTSATEGWVSSNVHASYLHVHGAGHPEHAERLVALARSYAASVPA